MKFNSLTIPGPKKRNQDSILLPFMVGNVLWCAIADGVGSAEQGLMAAEASLNEVKVSATEKPNMQAVFSAASKRLRMLAETGINGKSLATTLSVLSVNSEDARVGHVGDTRITHFRGHGVMTRTKDQTEVQQLLDQGALSKNQARRYPRRNILTSVLAADRDFNLFTNEFQILKGDRILLTSDGFHTKIFRPQLAEISFAAKDFDTFWTHIKSLTSETRFDDDATCVAIEF